MEEKMEQTTEQTPNEKKKNPFLLGLKKGFRAIAFFVILGCLLGIVNCAMLPKNNTKKEGMANQNAYGFLAEPTDSLDVLMVGNSNAYSGFSPLEMWKEYGMTSYVSGKGRERVVESYHIIQTALQTQSPKVIVLETDGIFTKGDYRNMVDETLSKTINYYIPIFENHDQWKEISVAHMFDPIHYSWRSYSKGQFVNITTKNHLKKRSCGNEKDFREIDRSVVFYLDKIKSICDENKIKLVLCRVPCHKTWSYAQHNSIKDYADSRNLPFLDLDYDIEKVGVDWETDSRDNGTHLNIGGAKKVSLYLGKFLVDNYQVPDHRDNQKLSNEWNYYYKKYEKKVKDLEKKSKVKKASVETSKNNQ